MTMRSLRVLIISGLLLGLAAPSAFAQGTDAKPAEGKAEPAAASPGLKASPEAAQAAAEDKLSFSAHGRFRFRHNRVSNFPVDADGARHWQKSWGTFLLRIKPELHLTRDFFLKGDVQLLDGQLYGDEYSAGGDDVLRPWMKSAVADQILLRQAWVQIPVGVGLLRVGRMESHWGLGILANGGDREEYPFADASHGDLSNRVLFAMRPLMWSDAGVASRALVLVLAGDYVEQDELTDRSEGDRAIQAVGAVAWRERKQELGVYFAYRDLKKENGDKTKALAADLFARWHGSVAKRLALRAAMEAVFITGTTEQARFEGADFPLDVRQFGCVLKGDITHTFYRAGAGLELGFASGDNSTQDSTLRNIKFDPSYKVGMILFEEVLARISARSHDRVRDPELVGTPPKGSDLIPTNGSVTNAIYIHPQIFVRPDSGAYDLRLGFLAAFAPGDVVDPFASAEAGGFNRNAFRKKNANGALGYEVNAGLAFDIPVQKLFTLRLGGQYGIFFPGAALEAVDGVDGLDSIQKWRLLADLRW